MATSRRLDDLKKQHVTIERRAFERHPIQWDATISGNGFEGLPVVIRDFCSGGVFLERRKAPPLSSGGSPQIAQDILVRFFNPAEGRLTETGVRIVRQTADGLGAAFHQPQSEVVKTLGAIAKDQQTARQEQMPAPTRRSRLADEVLQLCHEHVEAFCRRTLPDFASHAVDELFERARGAANNEEQSAYFAAFRQLRDLREEIPERFTKALIERLDALAEPPGRCRGSAGSTDEKPVELALVDDREFEDWLSRSEVVNRAERRFLREIEAIDRRLTFVVGHSLDATDSPLAPAGICEPIADALPLERLDNRAVQAIYEVFGQVVMQALGSLYDPLNARLRERGVLPEIEKERPTIHPLGDGVRSESARSAILAPWDAAAREPAADAPARGPTDGVASEIHLNWERRIDLPQAAGTPGQSVAAPALPSARQLLTTRRELREAQAAAPGAAARAAPVTPPPPVTIEERQVAEVLGRLRNDADESPKADDNNGLMSRVLAALRRELGEERALAPETRDTVELLDEWFGDIQHNTLNTDFLRDWSSRIATLALRVQLESGDFLSDAPKPIHHLLNQLDRAGLALTMLRGEERQRLQDELGALLRQTLAEPLSEPEALGTTAERIGGLIERPLQTRATNMRRVLQQCEGAQRLERARQRVDAEIDRRIAGREIPKLLLDFLDQGWRSVMVLLLLRTGERGGDWRRAVAVIDRLSAALGGVGRQRQPIREPEKVLAFVKRQLADHGRLDGDLKATVAALGEQVLAVCRGGQLPPPLPMVTAPEPRRDRRDPIATVSPEWLGQAKLLRVGDWVFFPGQDGTPERLRLLWLAEDGSRFVFVNLGGHKARELSLAELGRQLETGSASIAETLDQPLTERQWQRRLQAMHEQVVRYATHDPLTGLLNRKALLREIKQLDTRTDRDRHAVIHLSLDDFKVVNGTLGHEAGDEVLQAVARELSDAVGPRGVVGRAGGDEFTLLLRDCSAAEAEALAEERRHALNEYRATSGGQSLTLSGSLGVVPFRPGEKSAGNLLKDADEACLTAKHAGGNRVHVVTADDRELQRLRSSMASAVRVDAALESGLLRLRCQRIQPVFPEAGLRPFYEILVALKEDQAGHQLIPPDEFIPAAERFGRMTAVDRWVTRETVTWCAAHRDVLEAIGGFSVNLSGLTLNDDGFADFLRSVLNETGVPGTILCFEITETAAVRNLSRATDLIRAVKALGCDFSLDDFGSGLSSYSYLKKLPVDYLKIDGQFVRDIDHNPEDHAIVRSINDLGHFLGKHTIAEFVENEEILYQLRDIGLDFAQGFGIERPIPIDELGKEPA